MHITIRQGFEARPVAESNGALPDVSVFIDVVRAATTLAALLSRRPCEVLATNDLEVVERLKDEGYLLVSEVFEGGYDNSPTQMLGAMVDAATRVVHKSTNLTTMIFAGRPFKRALVCGFANLSATAAWVRDLGIQTLEIVPSGHRGKEALEDTTCAAMLEAAVKGGAWEEIPRLESIRSHFADLKRTRPSYPEHYWRDLELAFSLDLIPIVIEAIPLSEGVMRMAAQDQTRKA